MWLLCSTFYFEAQAGLGEWGDGMFLHLLVCFFFCMLVHWDGETRSVGFHFLISQCCIMHLHLHLVWKGKHLKCILIENKRKHHSNHIHFIQWVVLMFKFKFQTENTLSFSRMDWGGRVLLSLMEITFSLLTREDAFQVASKVYSREQQPCHIMFLHFT